MSSMGKQLQPGFCLLMDANKNKGWVDGPGRFASQGSSALRMQHPLERGGGRHSPRGGGGTGRHDKRHHCNRWSLGIAEKLLPGHQVRYLGTLPRLGRSGLQNLWYSTLSAPLARDRHCRSDGAYHTLQG